MRVTSAIVACVGLALLAGGCETVDRTYLREGIGTDVGSTDIVTETNIQQIYFGEVCRQAGLIVRPTPEGVVLCDEPTMSPAAWTTFVQAGMNDIDRRCDAYLAWLDDRRRWREPALKQLHSTAAITAAIMGLTAVGATPIAIVGAAFGFAQETFVNLSGRLVTEINQSTIQSLVLTRQNEYRDGLRNKVIPNRPAALYALRSYLRLCMPMTIETEINATVTSVDRNNMPAGRMITPATVIGGIITDPVAPLPRQERQRIVTANRLNAIEQALSDRTIKAFQAVLCVRQDGDLGPPGSETRMAIRDYLAGLTGSSGGETLTVSSRNLLSAGADKVGNCSNSAEGFENAYEVGAFGAARGSSQVRIKDFQANLRAALTEKGSALASGVPDTGALDAKTRDSIAEYRRITNTTLSGGASNPRNRQVDIKLKNSVTP